MGHLAGSAADVTAEDVALAHRENFVSVEHLKRYTTLGMGTGMSVLGTVTSAIAPTLIADAGWNEAEFALIGTISLLTVLAMPFIGRLADVLGVRLTAGIGIVTLPLAFLAYSFTNGSLIAFVSVFVVQSLICVTTTSTVPLPISSPSTKPW